MANFAQMPNGHIWIYVVLGAIIFIETGLVIFPFYLGIQFCFRWFIGGDVKRKIINRFTYFSDGDYCFRC